MKTSQGVRLCIFERKNNLYIASVAVKGKVTGDAQAKGNDDGRLHRGSNAPGFTAQGVGR